MHIKKDLIAAVFAGNSRQAISALRKGANANASYRGRPLLFWAIQEGRLNVVKALVHAGASLEKKDSNGFTPLDHAVGENNLKVVKFFIVAGANVNGRCSNGSPLHTACAWRRPKIVKILLSYGANPNARDKDGRKPVEFTKPSSNKIDKAICKLLKSNSLSAG